ncbi:hypothetical protein [Photorhabdus tasmaniensis]|uniref:Glycosyl transferase n=1 Tax=Photorhabdus tasmaniensis TaxID=1004159 RepID=A0ABX0GH43_9GAMM|nr:hypothetical protein [Photorhabdus tasmaniensis]NHB87593.1 hypothetical protein [Photorhabdus tasmaniensis]
MRKYNFIEYKIANTLRKFPKLKASVKKIYSIINYFINKKNYSIKTDFKVKKISDNNKESFFGYYDKSPENFNGEYILFHSVENGNTTKKPNTVEKIFICVMNRKTGKIVAKIESSAFNWQQGSKAQWLNNDTFIFNDYNYNTQNYISNIYSIKAKKIIKNNHFPIYDISSTLLSATIDFRRLSILRPDYGYFSHKSISLEKTFCKIDIYDLSNQKLLLCLELDKLITQCPSNFFQNETIHKFNHLMFSPDGTHLLFIHRFYNLRIRHDRLICFNLKTEKSIALTKIGIVSHCFWIDNETVFGFMEIDNKKAYYYININTLLYKEYIPLSNFGDGHPSVKSSFILTDTYPDRARNKSLILSNINNQKAKIIASVFEPLKYNGQTRCDLHPRFSYNNGNRIYIDSVHENKRHLYLLELKENDE